MAPDPCGAGWLSPVAAESPRKKVREQSSTRRASNRGCLPMTLEQYLKLLDWTGRQIHRDKIGKIDSECAPILERLECSAETWLDFVKNFRKRFRVEAGLPKAVLSFREFRQSRRAAVVS
jgi:hypothetical protein